MAPLSIHRSTEPIHVVAHPAPVMLTSNTRMSNGTKKRERGRRMAPVKPKCLSRLGRSRRWRFRGRRIQYPAPSRVCCGAKPAIRVPPTSAIRSYRNCDRFISQLAMMEATNWCPARRSEHGDGRKRGMRIIWPVGVDATAGPAQKSGGPLGSDPFLSNSSYRAVDGGGIYIS